MGLSKHRGYAHWKELYFVRWSENYVWNMYCRWEINVWATEVGWCFPFMFVSQWWLVSWLLHLNFTAFCTVPPLKPVLVLMDGIPSLQRGNCITSSELSANLPWVHSIPLSHRSGKLHITYRYLFSANGLVWIWAWSDCVNSLSLFPQEELLQVQSTTDAYPGRSMCAPALGDVVHWIHQPISFCLCFHCSYWDFSCHVLWYHCHWYHMGRRDISVVVTKLEQQRPKECGTSYRSRSWLL